MPRLLLALLAASLILITLAIMMAVSALAPETEEGHNVRLKTKTSLGPR